MGVWTLGGMVKPLSRAILATLESWAEAEIARPQSKVAVRVRVSPMRLSLEVSEGWVESLLLCVLRFLGFILSLLN
jgi:hypothetical protein